MPPSPNENQLITQFEKLSSRKLFQIIETESEDYTAEALEVARKVLVARKEASTLGDDNAEFREDPASPKDLSELRSESRLAGWAASVLLLGAFIVLGSVLSFFNPEPDVVTATLEIGVGLAIIILGIIWVRNIKKSQGEEA